jgi:hypothetical protein
VGQRNKNLAVDNVCSESLTNLQGERLHFETNLERLSDCSAVAFLDIVTVPASMTRRDATFENVTLRTRREAQGPQGLEGTALECRFK